MPKRTISYYEDKIKKLQQKSYKKRRRIIISSSSDSDENEELRTKIDEVNTLESDPISQLPEPLEVIPDSQPPECEILDPDMLTALGDSIDEQPKFGENIHITLAQRWLPILKKGLTKEHKEKLLKEYLIPDNCKLLKAPTLNPEITAAVPELVRNRDNNIKMKQDQLGVGIAAISKAITLLLLSDDKLNAIRIISDGCRILNDLHQSETQVRTKLITPCLEKSFMQIVQEQDRDETLFGNNLSEKIKASKALNRQGDQIKKPRVPVSAVSSNTVTGKPRYQGNWQGPPRFASSNRGGRGGYHSYRRQPAPPPMMHATTSSTRFPTSSSNQHQNKRCVNSRP